MSLLESTYIIKQATADIVEFIRSYENGKATVNGYDIICTGKGYRAKLDCHFNGHPQFYIEIYLNDIEYSVKLIPVFGVLSRSTNDAIVGHINSIILDTYSQKMYSSDLPLKRKTINFIQDSFYESYASEGYYSSCKIKPITTNDIKNKSYKDIICTVRDTFPESPKRKYMD